MNLPNRPERKLRVAVLMGGTSAEREVSLSTGKMILSALDPQKYLVTAIDTQDIIAIPGQKVASIPGSPPPPSLGGTEAVIASHSPSPAAQREIRERGPGSEDDTGFAKPDVVFIALHGKGGEDGAAQGMLELLGLPYTGSGVLASALAMNKGMTKKLFQAAGIPVIPDVQIPRGHEFTNEALITHVEGVLGGFPVFVKPNAEGSTFGCALVKSAEQLPQAVANALRYDSIALIEKYVKGMEITVGVLEKPEALSEFEPLPVIEIVPKNEYYDYESKYAEGGSEHIIPARLPESTLRRAQEIAALCHRTLGCQGMSRTDMLVTQDEIFVLEVNTIPGMTPTSLLPQAADHAGISFTSLLDRLIACALHRAAENAGSK